MIGCSSALTLRAIMAVRGRLGRVSEVRYAGRLAGPMGLMARFAAGIPTIVKPFFGDQFFWADRVEALGIGTAVRKLTVQSLTEALVSATHDPRQIERAKAVGEQIRSVRFHLPVPPTLALNNSVGGRRWHCD